MEEIMQEIESEECETTDKNSGEKSQCQFPFIYQGETFTGTYSLTKQDACLVEPGRNASVCLYLKVI